MTNHLFAAMLATDPAFYLIWVAIVMFSICVHEAAHAWTAAWRGDHLAQFTGFLTLNPLKTMGPVSIAMLLLFGIAWGAVPVNRQALRTRGNFALVAAAGPLANLALASLFALASGFLAFLASRQGGEPAPIFEHAHRFVRIGAYANTFLFLFNLIPVPPLDGFEVATAAAPRLETMRRGFGAAATLILFVLIFLSPAGSYLWGAAALLSHLAEGAIFAALSILA
ncbi:MAG: site-2 protease family protein [Lentisphaeria bacterium]|jgi:Zn-dependent protease